MRCARERGSRRGVAALLAAASVGLLGVTVVVGCGGGSSGGQNPPPVLGNMVVLGYNDLGMHCMNEDFSEICILPPYNTLHAQVIDRSGDDPSIVTSGITVDYSIPTNTRSADKTNFWTYAPALFGTALAQNVGLAGNGLSGTMQAATGADWQAVGIPLTPVQDNGTENSYALSLIKVSRAGTVQAQTQAVTPVSWEIDCNLCHKTAGISTATDILRAHDRLHGTTLEQQKPVLCAKCHADPALGAAGTSGTSTMSSAMHTSHASRMAAAGLTNVCYACHPGVKTQCLRDVHYSRGMVCTTCHGDMTAVGSPARRPWADEPRCGSSACHNKAGSQYEQTGVLYRNSQGHHGVRCSACHGSPHAVTPTVVAADNVQAIAVQGHSGTISECTVCHRSRPDEAFTHSLTGG